MSSDIEHPYHLPYPSDGRRSRASHGRAAAADKAASSRQTREQGFGSQSAEGDPDGLEANVGRNHFADVVRGRHLTRLLFILARSLVLDIFGGDGAGQPNATAAFFSSEFYFSDEVRHTTRDCRGQQFSSLKCRVKLSEQRSSGRFIGALMLCAFQLGFLLHSHVIFFSFAWPFLALSCARSFFCAPPTAFLPLQNLVQGTSGQRWLFVVGDRLIMALPWLTLGVWKAYVAFRRYFFCKRLM